MILILVFRHMQNTKHIRAKYTQIRIILFFLFFLLYILMSSTFSDRSKSEKSNKTISLLNTQNSCSADGKSSVSNLIIVTGKIVQIMVQIACQLNLFLFIAHFPQNQLSIRYKQTNKQKERKPSRPLTNYRFWLTA